jgi:predicted Zn finger-like uncharacterized protein
MILACPACRTRYQVEDRAVSRPPGRTVRCAKCGHSWHYPAAPAAPAIRIKEPLPPLPDPGPAVVTPRAAITAPPPPRRRHGGGAGVALILVLIAAGAAAGAYFAREQIIAAWPQAARFYAMVGLSSEAPGAGLAIVNVTSTRNIDGLIVEGDIANRVAVPRAVPQLRVALRDAADKEVAVKIIDPPKPRLLPGETAHFVAAFMPANDAAVGVVVTFAPG